MNISDWLRNLGLEQYEPAFREHRIDGAVLRSLVAEDLKDIGVNLVGHRRKLLDAIAALHLTRLRLRPTRCIAAARRGVD